MNVAELKKKALLIKIMSGTEKIGGIAKLYRGEIIAFALSFFFGFASLFGVTPFGIAVLCAYERERLKISEKISALLGICFGAFFFEKGVCSVVGALVAYLTLVWFNQKGKNGTLEKLFASALSSVGFAPLGILPFLSALFLVPFFALAFSGVFHRGKAVSSSLVDVGFLSIAFAVSFSLSKINVGFLCFGVASAVFFCLEGGERNGYFLGALSGFFFCVALGVELIVPFVISGFACGIYIRKKRGFAIVLYLAVWIAVSVWSGAFSFGNFISVFWGACFWVSLSGLYLDKRRECLPRQFAKNTTMGDKKISEALCGIALALSGVSKAKRREREERVKTVVESIFCSECEPCVGCSVPVEQLKNRICHRVIKNKKITELDFSEGFKGSCSRWKFIMEKTNETIKETPYKTSLKIDLLSEDYMSMSRILAVAERRAENRCYHDKAMANKLKLSLELKNIRALSVDVTGARLPFVEIGGVPFKIPFPEKEIKKETERIFGRSFEVVHFEAEGKIAKIGLKASLGLKVDFHKISIPKKGEIICGDSVSAFENEDGFFYSLINDGMGSGRDAAVCSRLGVVFLEKLISAGIDKSLAVSMLGNIIASSEDEIFTTVDLLEVDLVRGKLTSIKSGASPTWVLRDKRAYSISSKTLPCGIISSVNAEKTVLDCFAGDIIIMASDGGEGAVAEAIKIIFAEKRSMSAKEIAVCLADIATRKEGRIDDITFAALTIL